MGKLAFTFPYCITLRVGNSLPWRSLGGGALNSTEESAPRTWHWCVHLKELFLMGTPFTKHLLSTPTVSLGEASGNGDKFITPKL